MTTADDMQHATVASEFATLLVDMKIWVRNLATGEGVAELLISGNTNLW